MAVSVTSLLLTIKESTSVFIVTKEKTKYRNSSHSHCRSALGVFLHERVRHHPPLHHQQESRLTPHFGSRAAVKVKGTI